MSEIEKLEDSHKFKLWKSRLLTNGMDIHQIDEIFSRRIGNGKVLFSLVLADATTPEGNKIPPICFIKGEVVCVLICLIDKETKEKYLLLVKQRRICDGSMTFEHPAGMLDSELDAAAVAAREVQEETSIAIDKSELIQLINRPSYPSTGTSDEAMYFFYCELVLSKAKIDSYHNQSQGVLSEHEFIETYVAPFAEAHQLITNTNGILLNYLYLKDVKDWDMMQKI